MPSLKDLLDELEIEVPKEPEKKVEIPEELKPAFDEITKSAEDLKDELAKRDLVIQTLQGSIKKDPEPVDPKPKVFGDLEEDDPYAKHFKTLSDQISGLSQKTVVDEQKVFEDRLVSFAKENKDIVRYANDMDSIAKEHPTLMNDIPKLYTLAKRMVEGREKAKKPTETIGTAPDNVIPIQHGKTIAEAFELAENKIGGR